MDPVEQLKIEHQHILRGLELLNRTSRIIADNTVPEKEINLLVQFFKNYADQGHHSKEEDILFNYLREKDEILVSEFTPVGTLIDQHVQGRQMVSSLAKIDEKYNVYVVEYDNLLRRHIEIEDQIFPVLIDDHFSETEQREIYLEFQSTDAKLDLNKELQILDKVEVLL